MYAQMLWDGNNFLGSFSEERRHYLFLFFYFENYQP